MTTQEARYSSKLATPAMLGIAGYESDETYFNPRVSITPCEELQKLIFPWIESQLTMCVQHGEAEDKPRTTAIATLKFWMYLRKVILQDAACMFVECPGRVDHPVFNIKVFQSRMFTVSWVSWKCFCNCSFLIFISFFSFYFAGVCGSNEGSPGQVGVD